MEKQRRFYGIESNFGFNVRNQMGHLIGKIHTFPSMKERDVWVEEAKLIPMSNAGSRISLYSWTKEVRYYLKEEKDWPGIIEHHF